jgi:MSHA biogenesis protein MshP
MKQHPIKQQGFMLVMVIFMVVILGLLGSYMVRLSGTQHATASAALQGVRAYQVAKAGLDWSIATLRNGGNCTSINAQSALTFPDINGFTVALSCSSNSYAEGDATVTIVRLIANSRFGAYDSVDYVARELEVSINLIP